VFRKQLKSSLQEIFGISKTTFDAPSDKFEQDTLFIEVAESPSSVGSGIEKAKVTGFLTVYAQEEKLPFGFFNKKIMAASPTLTKKFFFGTEQNVATSPARTQNITERRMDFLFLYSSQYDPNLGELTQVNFCNEGEA
jgi:hypothetical protein